MKLQHSFPQKKREVFRDYQYKCLECSENGQRNGGTELHHIRGRISSSVFNGAVLCKKCHSSIGHTFEEEKKYLQKTAKIIFCAVELGNYILDKNDKDFLIKNSKFYN